MFHHWVKSKMKCKFCSIKFCNFFQTKIFCGMVIINFKFHQKQTLEDFLNISQNWFECLNVHHQAQFCTPWLNYIIWFGGVIFSSDILTHFGLFSEKAPIKVSSYNASKSYKLFKTNWNTLYTHFIKVYTRFIIYLECNFSAIVFKPTMY